MIKAIRDLERQLIVDALIEYNGCITIAARAVGISRASIYRKLKKYGINPDDYRGRIAA